VTTEVVRAEGLTKEYRLGTTQLRVLDGVNLNLADREMAALTGPSGSGKSTLLHLLGCLDRPTAGRYWLLGEEVSALPARHLVRFRREHLGFVFQTFNLLPKLSALENVALPLVYRGVAAAARRVDAKAALERVGLGHRLKHKPTELSGGEQQRVAIARAVVGHPRLILADEPTGNLDSGSGAQVLDLLRSLVDEGHSVLLVTHDVNIAAKADRQIHLSDGKIVR
jgi:putative ABC transport system ATP-binding protein